MAQFTDKWGKSTARSRYGSAKETISVPSLSQTEPQSPGEGWSKDYLNDTSGWVHGQGQNPNFKRGP